MPRSSEKAACKGFTTATSFTRLVLVASLTGAPVWGHWFVVASSQVTVAPALAAEGALRAAWPAVTVMASADCDNLRPGLYLTAIPASDARAAQSMITQLRSQVKDVYVRECRPKPDSRVRLGLPLIDPSIAGVPANTVNWTDADRVSTVHKLAGGGYAWVRRRYEASPEDPREGRREAVWFFEASPASARQMESDCTDPSFARLAARLALSCARETAAEHLLHTTFVYRIGVSAPTQSIRRCRSPRFTSETELTCQEETISGAGELRLTRKRVALNVSP